MYEQMQTVDPETRRKLQNSIIERNMPLVAKLAGKFNHNYNEFFQLGCLGLVKAVRTYDTKRGEVSSFSLNVL